MSSSASTRRAAASVALMLICLPAFASCSNASDGTDEGPTDVSALSEAGQERFETLYEGTGTSPATESPQPQPGKNIWVITAGMSVEAVANAAKGVEDASESIGWNAKIIDGQLTPSVWLTGIQQAVAADADGIILYAIDCAYVQNGLTTAKRAGIPVVGIESENCDPALETVVPYADGDFAEWGKQLGSDMALYLAAHGEGKGKFIELRETDLAIARAMTDGLKETLADECPECELVSIDFTGADIGPALQQKVAQALTRHPDAIGIAVPYDDLLVAGVSSAVVGSGRADAIQVISTGGSSAALELMRGKRGLNADLVIDPRWEAYAAVDWMNRILHGETPTAEAAPTGIGHQLIEAGRGLPKSGPVPPAVDFVAAYEKSWGISK